MEPNTRLPGIQAGRAVAALAVFYFHSPICLTYFDQQPLHTISWLAANGAEGVELFFCISGFIVCYIAERSDFAPGGFLLKRLFRIYPLNVLVTAIMMWIVLKWGIPIADPFNLRDATDSILIIPQRKPINSVGWTLEFEIMFYFLSAILIPIGGRRLLLLYCVVSGFAGWLLEPSVSVIARLVNTHYLDFGSGILAYFAFEKLLNLSKDIRPWLLSFLCIAAGVLFFNYGPALTPFYLQVSCLMAVAGLAILPWAPAWIVKLGDISYGIYLIHWPVLGLMGSAAFRLLPNPELGELWRWQTFLGVCLLAQLSWTYLERPINRWAHRKRAASHSRPSHDIARGQGTAIVQ
ncbi:acyltransferase family protein [Bradyrhizobium sp. UFLA05-112]